ncbi:MAG: hypothetical protein JW866_00050 [Ignavibacteriales bacterium]|nr:hypothetical protein [Ignavibacteriales bacterium]
MKASIFFFHGANCKHEELTGYKHNQEVPVEDIFNIVAFIFGTGLNVMLYHSDENIIIMVDDKRFQQR